MQERAHHGCNQRRADRAQVFEKAGTRRHAGSAARRQSKTRQITFPVGDTRMNFAEASEIQAKVRERRKTHWVLRLVTPVSDDYKEMPKSKPDRLIFGAFKPDFLDGATVYAAGAVNPLTQGPSFVALPSPGYGVKQ